MIFLIHQHKKQSSICGNVNGLPLLQVIYQIHTPAKALKMASEAMFPNVHQFLRLICIIPVSSCECEHSVSVLSRLKTYLKSSMSQERLSGLALML